MTIKKRIINEINKLNDTFKAKDIYNKIFVDIPYETFRKAILRLADDGVIEAVDRGIYKVVGVQTEDINTI